MWFRWEFLSILSYMSTQNGDDVAYWTHRKKKRKLKTGYLLKVSNEALTVL